MPDWERLADDYEAEARQGGSGERGPAETALLGAISAGGRQSVALEDGSGRAVVVRSPDEDWRAVPMDESREGLEVVLDDDDFDDPLFNEVLTSEKWAEFRSKFREGWRKWDRADRHYYEEARARRSALSGLEARSSEALAREKAPREGEDG